MSIRFHMLQSAALLLAAGLTGQVEAGAVLYGSTGSSGTFSGDFEIPAAVGRIEGGNLFHSFGAFSVDTGESATFTGPTGIDNVISRVTGGAPSAIDGPLASTVPGADFFFVNPAGVIFGPNATLSVDGSFHVGAADELRFADGSAFSALGGGGGSFTAAAPTAFGFLGGGTSGVIVDRGALAVGIGERISLVGDFVVVSAGDQGPISGGSSGVLSAPGGAIRLAALRGAAFFDLASGEVAADAGGDILLTDQANLQVFSGDGGGIKIRADSLTVEDQAAIQIINLGPATANGAIDIQASDIRVRRQGNITTTANGTGRAAPLDILAGELRINGTSVVGSDTFGAGSPGPVSINANRIEVRQRGGILTSSQPGTSGSGGDIVIRAGTLLVANALINTSKLGTGRLGRISIDAEDITMSNGGGILAATLSAEPSGLVAIRTGTLRIDGGSIFTSSLSTGDGGSIVVDADALEVRNGGILSAATFASGVAGDVTVRADRITVGGNGSQVSVDSLSNAPEGGDAGALQVEAGVLRIQNGGFISSDTAGGGNAGTVTVDAGRLLANGSTGGTARISTNTREGATGRGGVIVVRADDIVLRNGGAITGLTLSDAPSGAITVEAGQLVIAGGGLDRLTGISSDAFLGQGDAGPVVVRASDIEIRAAGRISSNTGSVGNAGSVVVDADDLRLINSGSRFLTALASDALPGSSGNAGNVLVSVDTFSVGRGAAISSSTQGSGNAGQVLIATADGLIEGDVRTISTTAGRAGNIALAAPRLEVRDGGLVGSSSSETGVAGNVLIRGERILVDHADIRTEGLEGGLIDVRAGDVLDLVEADVTSNGITPRAGASIITLESDTLVVNSSRVTSLTGEGVPITGSGEAALLGDLTVISDDSDVRASSSLEVTGLEGDVTAGIEVLSTAFIDVSGLLRESCAARASDQTSSFATTGGGRIAPDPTGPLSGSYARASGTLAPAAFHGWSLFGWSDCHG